MRRTNRFLAATMACLLVMSLVLVHPFNALAEYEEQQDPIATEETTDDGSTEEGAAGESPAVAGPLEDIVKSMEQEQTEQGTEGEEQTEISPFAATYQVRFFDWEGTTQLGDTQYIVEGEAAVAPEVPSREGYRFTGWSEDFNSVTRDLDILAQYVELDSYTITINYIFANSTLALQPVVFSVAEGDSFTRDIDSPAIAGYTPDTASLEIDLADVQQDYVYTVTYTPAGNTPYKVEHYKQDLVLTNGENPSDPANFTLEDTDELTGQTAARVTAGAKSYTGFSPPAKMPSAQIAADGSTVLKVYYTRNQYALYFDTAGGSYVAPVAALYEEPLTPPEAPTRAGYTFTGWSPEVPAQMPAGDVNLTAGWTPSGTVGFTYVYWLENIDSSGYDYVGSSAGSSMAGTEPTATGTVPSGVNFPIASTRYSFNSAKTNGEKPAAINGDGTTIVNLYYDRNSYTLSFTFNATKYQLTVGDTTYTTSPYRFQAKYGAPIADKWPGTPTLKTGQTGDGVFVGWTGGSTNYVTKQYNLSDSHITGGTFAATWSASSKKVTVNYYFQDINSTSYSLGDTQEVAVQNSSTTWNSKTFVGFTARQSSVTIPSNNIVNFQYTRNQYSITYYNGGTIARNTQNIPYQMDISGYGFAPDKPDSVPAGYVFDGWYTTAQGYQGSEYDFAGKTMPAHSLILYAHWVKPQYTVTFQPDNGDASFTQTVYALETLTEPTPPTKPGYVFGGWYRQGAGLHYVFNFPVNSDMTLTARWIAENNITYDVVYMKGSEEYLRQSFGGNAVGDSVTASAITIPDYLPDQLSKSLVLQASGNEIVFYYQPFDRVGYTVRYVDTNNVSLRPDKNATTSQDSVTENYINISGYSPDYYQQTLQLTPEAANNIITFTYTPNAPVDYTVRIVHEAVDGSYVVYDEYVKQAAAGSIATETPPVYPGFSYQPGLSANGRVVASNGSTLLRLYYNRDQFTVDFTTEGNGSLVGQTSYPAIRYGNLFNNIVTIPIPVADPGYAFVGWQPGLPGAGDTVTANATYTAVFEKDDAQWATVTLRGNGADNDASITSEELLIGSEYTLPPNPFTRQDFDFTFWDTSAAGDGASYADGITFTVTQTLVLYAQWVPEDKYTVAYLNNGATGAVYDNTVYEDDDEVTVKGADGFTYPGYTFVEWTDDEGVAYEPGDTFDIQRNMVFTAQWQKDDTQWVTIVYNKNSDDATGVMSSEEILVGAQHTLAPNLFARPNYTFAGWDTQPEGGGQAYEDRDSISPLVYGTLNLYAQWAENPKFDITYYSNNDTPETIPDSEVYAGVPHTIYPADTFTYENHDFVRWSQNADGSGTRYLPGSTVFINDDLDLYAFWKLRQLYTVTYLDGYGSGSFTDEEYADADGLLDFTVADNPFIRLGYDFLDWMSDTNTIAYPRAEILDMNRNIEFTAEWTPTPYTIAYELDGGAVNGVNPTVYNIETPTFELVNPTKPGYTFMGWTGTHLERETEEVVIARGGMGDLSYTAHWQRDDTQWVTISFESEDEAKGTLEGTLSYEGVIGEAISLTRLVSIAYPLALPADGYTFARWSEEIPAVFPETDMVITAYWQLLPTTPSSGTDPSGPTGSGPTGSGPTGSGPAGSGPAGSGPDASGPAGGASGAGGASNPVLPDASNRIASSPLEGVVAAQSGARSSGSGSAAGGSGNTAYGTAATGNNRTGDASHPWVWAGLMLLAAGSITLLLLRLKRSARHKKQ